MIQMPFRKLRRRDAAWEGIKQSRNPVEQSTLFAGLKNGIVDNFIQENGKVKDRESERKSDRDPDPGLVENDEEYYATREQ